MAREKAEGQIYRIDGRDCFVEIMSESFSIGQVQMNFAQYNTSLEKGSRQTAFIPIYLSIPEFLALSSDVMIGRMAQKAERAKKSPPASGTFTEPLFSVLGGTSKERLREMGKSRPDGMSVSRKMTIGVGSKYPYLLTAEQGAGQTDAKGLIVPRYTDKKPEAKISIPVKEESLREMFSITSMYIQAFITSRMLSGVIPTAKPERSEAVKGSRSMPEPPPERSGKAAPVPKISAAPQPVTPTRVDDGFDFLDSATFPEPPPVRGAYPKAV